MALDTARDWVVVCSIGIMWCFFNFFFFNDTATTEIYTLSLHDALPIYVLIVVKQHGGETGTGAVCAEIIRERSEEHTSELQSHSDLVCRLLLEKKKKKQPNHKRDTYSPTGPKHADAKVRTAAQRAPREP